MWGPTARNQATTHSRGDGSGHVPAGEAQDEHHGVDAQPVGVEGLQDREVRSESKVRDTVVWQSSQKYARCDMNSTGYMCYRYNDVLIDRIEVQ